jgi:hypothetical protein
MLNKSDKVSFVLHLRYGLYYADINETSLFQQRLNWAPIQISLKFIDKFFGDETYDLRFPILCSFNAVCTNKCINIDRERNNRAE